jgi:phosphotransacetylase
LTNPINLFEESLSKRFQTLLKPLIKRSPIKIAVICPESPSSLQPALQALECDIIEPIFIGSLQKMQHAAKALKEKISLDLCINLPKRQAVEKGIALIRNGEAEALMKGSLHTDELMMAIVDHDRGLYANRRMSHVMLMDIPSYHKPLIITDGALNVHPKLIYKKDIVENSIDFAKRLGITTPKVALLSAVETRMERIPSTLDCAALKEMAQYGDIEGGIVDGPLAFDAAISAEAAKIKKIESPVSGNPDILMVPSIEAGNMLIKSLQYLSKAKAYGLVIGAMAPIVLTSRSASYDERIGSCLLAKLYMNR